jgi:hypothetical protein
MKTFPKEAHLTCVVVTFGVLHRLFYRFHPDVEPFQTNISVCSLSTSTSRSDAGTESIQEVMIYASSQRATSE